MEWIQVIESISAVALVVVTVGLLIATNMYRKATEEMANIQQKSLAIQHRNVEGRQKSMEVQQQNVEVQRQNVDYLKKDNALRLLERWDHPVLLEARRYIRVFAEKRASLSDEELIRQIEEDLGKGGFTESLVNVFNFWKSVQWAIAFERTDEEILKKAFRAVYIYMYDQFEVWLDAQVPGYKEDLEKLYNRWKSAS